MKSPQQKVAAAGPPTRRLTLRLRCPASSTRGRTVVAWVLIVVTVGLAIPSSVIAHGLVASPGASTTRESTPITHGSSPTWNGTGSARDTFPVSPPKPKASNPPYGNVVFAESGLASNTVWNITVDGYLLSSNSTFANATIIPFAAPNGSYTFEIEPVAGYPDPVPSSGYFTVDNFGIGSAPTVTEFVTFAAPSYFFVNVTASYGTTTTFRAVPEGGEAPFNYSWGITNLACYSSPRDCGPTGSNYCAPLSGYGPSFAVTCGGTSASFSWSVYATSSLILAPGSVACSPGPPYCAAAENSGVVYNVTGPGQFGESSTSVDFNQSSNGSADAFLGVGVSAVDPAGDQSFLNVTGDDWVLPVTFGTQSYSVSEVNDTYWQDELPFTGFYSFSFRDAPIGALLGGYGTGAYGQFSVTALPTYNVSFEQAVDSQLPSTTEWGVEFCDSFAVGLSGSSVLNFSNVTDGTYAFAIYPEPGYGAFVSGLGVVPSAVGMGNVTVSGDNATVNVTFLQYDYGILFNEHGLPQKIAGYFQEAVTNWSVKVTNDTTDVSTSIQWNITQILFADPNGTYSFSVGSIKNWLATPSVGTILVNGTNVIVNITFTRIYNVTFNETGLPASTSWSVAVDDIPAFNETTAGANPTGSVVVGVRNGTYEFNVTPISGTDALPASGLFRVNGHTLSISVAFVPQLLGLEELLSLYDQRPDLQAAYPGAATGNLTNLSALLNWASEVVTGQFSDSSYDALSAPDVGYYYTLMDVYNSRSDLQAAYPNATTNLTSYEGLVTWAGEVVTGQFTDSANATLSPWGYAYDVFLVYNERPDLQAAFPSAYTSLSNYTSLVNWAGGVVTNSFADSDRSNLTAFGYFYALMFVYDDRSDLQAAFPNAFSSATSYEGLLGWAKGVVLGDFTDSSFTTLLPFAASYEELG